MEKLSNLTQQYLEEDVGIAKMERGYLRQALAMCLELLKFVIKMKVDQKVPESAPWPVREKGLKARVSAIAIM